MTLSRLALATAIAAVALPALAQTPPVVTHERELIGQTWSGAYDEAVPGYEDMGGGFLRDGLAVSYLRGTQDTREWVLIAKREVGRDGQHAIWQATDAVRGTARSRESFIAFGCQMIGAVHPDEGAAGLIGIVGAERVGSDGLLRAQLAWRMSPDGILEPVTQPVGCYDEAEGV